jgi:ABC-type transporter Mla maintaining outer membrane lipid asymmetry ATPase subunit MlaF
MSCVQTVADKIIVLLDGKNSAEGTYDELAKSDIKQVKEFFE